MVGLLKKVPVARFLARVGWISSVYHLSLAWAGAAWYGFPSRKLHVIGVTGTKGKTTTANLIAHALMTAGYRTGLATTVNFRIGDREWVNDAKQTMLGRFALERLLSEMVRAGCLYAVIETSSEGILQNRHRFIHYRTAVFTNLFPEHIERHGGFENYRAAKVKLFAQVAKWKDGIGVYNLDDENIEHFLKPPVPVRYGYAMTRALPDPRFRNVRQFRVSRVALGADGSAFQFGEDEFQTPLIGEFNVMNAAATVCTAIALAVPVKKIQDAMRTATPPAGRMEVMKSKKGFTVVVDYSYEPKGFESALRALKLFEPKRVIALIGSAGGGRDKWRRPVLGELADRYADLVIVTTDDPYDEDPGAIVEEVYAGSVRSGKRVLGKSVFKIVDRRDAIEKALRCARGGDVVLIAGKGGERWMNLAGGKKIPWSDRDIVEGILASL